MVGASLAGMAAAARLAKAGHRVHLLEATDRLGGGWAPYDVSGAKVDDAPGVLTFPAPWRDLFRKSGRPLEAELTRSKVALSPAQAARYVFDDGSELVLPAERGGQYYALAEAYGGSVADRWRDLVDHLVDVWQTLRPLGFEAELRDRRQLSQAKKALRPRQSLADVADELDEPHLVALVRSVAYRLGSQPDQTPAWCAADLSVQRTFGRWCITSDRPGETGRSSVLVEALAARLALRRVDVQLGRSVVQITTDGARATGVTCADGTSLTAAAVICTTDPWQTHSELLGPPRWRTRRTIRRWQPAHAPSVHHELIPDEVPVVTETVNLSGDGRPRITYVRPIVSGSVLTTHDYTAGGPSRSAGLAWRGFRSWLDRPPIRSEVAGLFLAGPFSRAGAGASPVMLSGALASYACQEYLR